MRKIILFLLLTSVLMPICSSVSAQQVAVAQRDSSEAHNPIESAPQAGGRINGHVLDVDGNVIKGKARVCERDIVDRAVTIYNCDFNDGFFILFGIKSTDNYLTFEADGYETQKSPIDRSNYEVRLKPLTETEKRNDYEQKKF